jgi:asparagine N-glycosylation enzyme membrane subunit Stt3
MISTREIQKKYCSRAMSVAIVVGIILFLIGHTDYMKGLILGTFFSILNFVLIGESLPYRLNKKSGIKVIVVALGSMAFRYLLLAVPLVLALKFEQYQLFATIIGVFMIQIIILFGHIGENVLQVFKKTGI